MTGSAMIPAQKSAMARFRNIILDGGCREDSFRSTARIKEFPSNAVIERNMLSAARSISWFLIPAVDSGKQNKSA